VPLSAGCRTECPVKLLLRPSPYFVEFRVQPSDLGIQLDEAEALGALMSLSAFTPA
jgi:hypothetical protein